MLSRFFTLALSLAVALAACQAPPPAAVGSALQQAAVAPAAANSKQQTANSKQQTAAANSKQQTASSKQPTAAGLGPQPAQPRQTAALLTLPWGHAIGQLGHHPADESAPEGPMALDVGPDGRVAVLDQVNGRVQLFRDGQLPEVLALPTNAFQDLAFGADGQLWALQRHGTAQVIRVGSAAAPVALEHPALRESAAATALLVGNGGLWVEAEHGSVLPLHPTTPTQLLSGRFGPGSLLVQAALSRPFDAKIAARNPDGSVAWQAIAQVRTTTGQLLPLVALREWMPTADGGAWLVIEAGEGHVRRHQALRYTTGGQLAKTVDIPVPTADDEQFRPYRVAPDGALYALVCDTDAARVWRFAP